VQPQQRPYVPLTTFDERTARAVVAVLHRAGVPAAARPSVGEEVEVTVPEGARDEAMRILGSRMEEVTDAIGAADRETAARRPSAPAPDPDDVHAGPPLVMERLRSLSWLAAVFLVPLLAVTIAGPVRGDLRILFAVVLMFAVAGLLWWRRRR
jgi:hypothetical protein